MYIPPGVGWLAGWLQAFKATTSSEINGLRMEVTSAVQALAQTGAMGLVGLGGDYGRGQTGPKLPPPNKKWCESTGFCEA